MTNIEDLELVKWRRYVEDSTYRIYRVFNYGYYYKDYGSKFLRKRDEGYTDYNGIYISDALAQQKVKELTLIAKQRHHGDTCERKAWENRRYGITENKKSIISCHTDRVDIFIVKEILDVYGKDIDTNESIFDGATKHYYQGEEIVSKLK